MHRGGYELDFNETFDRGELDRRRWVPCHLPQWSSRDRSAARYLVQDGCLRLRIEAGQQPWCPEYDGAVRVSSLQTGVFAGPVGSAIGQHRFNPAAVVRQAQRNERLYTPQYGYFEMRAKVTADPHAMAALWMIGYEDAPDRSAEICVCEIFGHNVGAGRVGVGMGVHPFGDPRLVDDFATEQVSIDAREFHVYAAEWTPERVSFFVDDQLIRSTDQSPAYPMQLMLGIYEFPADGQPTYPEAPIVDYLRGYRPVG